MSQPTVPPLNWHFWHNGHRISVGLFHNKYDAATEFRNRYGYFPDLDTVVNVVETSVRTCHPPTLPSI